MQCSRCGATVPDGAVFCTSCGAPTAAGGQSPSGGAAAMPMAAPITEYAPEAFTDPVSGAALSSWGRRAAALLIDWVLMACTVGLVAGVIFFSGTTRTETGYGTTLTTTSASAALVAYLVGFVGFYGYFIVCTGSRRGQTLGKRALGIAVHDPESGATIGYGRATVRYLVILGLGAAFTVPLVIDYLSPLWNARQQAWHDMAARSVVVVVR